MTHALVVSYTNWQGVTRIRRVVPMGVVFRSSQWHPDPQWLLICRDVEKDELREFALKDCDFTVEEDR